MHRRGHVASWCPDVSRPAARKAESQNAMTSTREPPTIRAIDGAIGITGQHLGNHEAADDGHDPISCPIGRRDQRDRGKQRRSHQQGEEDQRKCQNGHRTDDADRNAAGEYPDRDAPGHLCRSDHGHREHHSLGAEAAFEQQWIGVEDEPRKDRPVCGERDPERPEHGRSQRHPTARAPAIGGEPRSSVGTGASAAGLMTAA